MTIDDIIPLLLALLSLFVGYFVSDSLPARFGDEAAHGLLAAGAFLVVVEVGWRVTAAQRLDPQALLSRDFGGRMSRVLLWCVGTLLLVLGAQAWS